MQVTPAFREYVAPLIAGEHYPSYHQGVPAYFDMTLPMRDKKLAAFDLES